MHIYKVDIDAYEKLKKAKTPHKGFHFKRTRTSKKELEFARAWADECEPVKGASDGFGLIQVLLVVTSLNWPFEIERVIRLTKKEKMVAATVIQWLGTNCGWSFLNEVLRKLGYKIVKIEND